MYSAAVLATFSFLLGAGAQQVGTLTPKPSALTIQKCASGGTCTDEKTAIVPMQLEMASLDFRLYQLYTGNTWDALSAQIQKHVPPTVPLMVLIMQEHTVSPQAAILEA
ncbi:hypothetical protein DID88_009337 [Monilinia fructigena]|uniref:Uncharacterized protein n=1 Tax=Monilinia fructigena TaxID=38457 RepID=A0A395IM81_9HELO|nr:hypothetical protein DID88_009337 [Monilinia fructigena]